MKRLSILLAICLIASVVGAATYYYDGVDFDTEVTCYEYSGADWAPCSPYYHSGADWVAINGAPTPSISAVPSSWDPADGTDGDTTAEQTITITASGAYGTISSISLTGGSNFSDAGTGTCEAGVTSLADTQSCTIDLEFDYTYATCSACSDTLVVTNGTNPLNVSLGETAVADGSALCSSCTPGDPADVFCEDFQSSNLCATGEASVCHCSWIVGGEDDGTVVFSTGGITISANSSGSYVEATHAINVVGSVYSKFNITINSSSLSDGQYSNLVIISGSGSGNALRLVNTSGTLHLDLVYSTGAITITGPNVSTSTEYNIEILFNETAGTMQLWVNDSDYGSDEGDYQGPWTTFSVGTYHPGAAVNYTVKDIEVDDDAMP